MVTRIMGFTMLSTASANYGGGFIAFDPEAEDADTLSIMEGLEEGAIFATSRDRGIILGKRLAKNLGTEMGKKVVYTLTDRNGEIVSGLARVSGIVRTGAPSLETPAFACFRSTRSGRFWATSLTRPCRWPCSSTTSARAARSPDACRIASARTSRP